MVKAVDRGGAGPVPPSPGTRYGSADAAEQILNPKSNQAAHKAAAERMRRQGMSADALEREAERRQAAARAAAAARSRAQAALRAVAPRAVEYKGRKAEYFEDASDFLARKYGLDRRLMTNPEYMKRYGLTPIGGAVTMRDGKPVVDAKGLPVKSAQYGYESAAKFGAKGVYMGYYDTYFRDGYLPGDEKGSPTHGSPMVDPEVSRGGKKKQYMMGDREEMIMPADGAKNLIYGWSSDKIKRFQVSMGLKPTGVPDSRTTKRWSEGINGAQKLYEYHGYKVTPGDYLDAKYGDKKGKGSGGGGGGRGGGGGGGGGGGASSTVKRTTLTNRTELQRALNAMFQDKLGRNATDQELNKYLSQVNSKERANPQIATSDAAGNTTVTGGVDPMQVAENYMNQVQGGEVGTRLAGVDYFSAAMRLIGGGDL